MVYYGEHRIELAKLSDMVTAMIGEGEELARALNYESTGDFLNDREGGEGGAFFKLSPYLRNEIYSIIAFQDMPWSSYILTRMIRPRYTIISPFYAMSNKTNRDFRNESFLSPITQIPIYIPISWPIFLLQTCLLQTWRVETRPREKTCPPSTVTIRVTLPSATAQPQADRVSQHSPATTHICSFLNQHRALLLLIAIVLLLNSVANATISWKEYATRKWKKSKHLKSRGLI